MTMEKKMLQKTWIINYSLLLKCMFYVWFIMPYSLWSYSSHAANNITYNIDSMNLEEWNLKKKKERKHR